MSCQHDFKLRVIGSVYTCTKCDMDLSVELYEMYQQAHRAGWEQAKRDAYSLSQQHSLLSNTKSGEIEINELAIAIANLEYKGPS